MKQIIRVGFCLISISLLSGCLGHGSYYTTHSREYNGSMSSDKYMGQEYGTDENASESDTDELTNDAQTNQTDSGTKAPTPPGTPMAPGVNAGSYVAPAAAPNQSAVQSSGVIPVGRSVNVKKQEMGTGTSGASTIAPENSNGVSQLPDVR